MRRALPFTISFTLLALLGACGNDAAGRGGLTEGEAEELDEAAEIVEAQAIQPEDLPQDLRPADGE